MIDKCFIFDKNLTHIDKNSIKLTNISIEMESKAVLLKMQGALFTLCCKVDDPLPRLKKLLTELYNKENLQFDTSANISSNKSITSGATPTDVSVIGVVLLVLALDQNLILFHQH